MNKLKTLRCGLLYAAFCIGFLAGSPTFAQRAARLQVNNNPRIETIKFQSRLAERELPYRVVLPVGYAAEMQKTVSARKKYPVLYLLHGLYGNYTNWTERARLLEYLAPYDLIIVTPEGGSGWYTDSLKTPTNKFESYIVQELFADVERRYAARVTRDGRSIAGLSMGGFGALKFGLKYPDKFVFAASLSGALAAARADDPALQNNDGIYKSLLDVFAATDDRTRPANDVFSIVKNASPEFIKTLPFIYVSCGTEDFLFRSNQDMATLLAQKKIPHEYRQLPGVHNWDFWNGQVVEVLRLADHYMNGK